MSVLVRDHEPLIMVAADRVDRSLDHVPGRGQHAFQVPVLSEFMDEERLPLQIWEGRTPVFRGGLYVDRDGEPMLRRVRDDPPTAETDAKDTVVDTRIGGRLKRWWNNR